MRTLLTLISLLACSLTAFAAPGQVKVSWDVHDDPYCTGYLVLYGSRSQRYSVTNVVEGRLNNSAVLTNLPVGVVYVVAQATGATERQTSIYSDELLWTNAPPALTPPRNIQLHAVIQSSTTTNGPWSDVAWVKTSGSATQTFRAVLFREDLR